MGLDFGFLRVLIAVLLCGIVPPAYAAKGDLRVSVPKRAPLLQGKSLDLRFAQFAQGVWVRNLDDCPGPSIDRTKPGSTIAIFRGLLETPERICQVYGAEHNKSTSQRAALNCMLNDGGEALGLVTVRVRGTEGLVVQDGEQAPAHFRFCKKIVPVLQSVVTD